MQASPRAAPSGFRHVPCRLAPLPLHPGALLVHLAIGQRRTAADRSRSFCAISDLPPAALPNLEADCCQQGRLTAAQRHQTFRGVSPTIWTELSEKNRYTYRSLGTREPLATAELQASAIGSDRSAEKIERQQLLLRPPSSQKCRRSTCRISIIASQIRTRSKMQLCGAASSAESISCKERG